MLKKETTKKPKILSENLFPVVGIGASAGGLDAFKKLVKAIPEKSGMAYILVQHLHPQYESALPEILQRLTKIPVLEIKDNVKVKPDCIYIIPSNKILVANDGVLKLSPRRVTDGLNLPIDIFFSSLAAVHQAHAIGVVLSGTGADGTPGLKDIKEHGGITFAQDPSTASSVGMPRNAIDAGVVDFIITPENLPLKLIELQNALLTVKDDELIAKDKTSQDAYLKIIALLKVSSGVDFSYYKQTTIRRRILRRMVILDSESVIAYANFMEKNKSEHNILFQDLLIPVTSFFRDAPVFDTLCEKIFPDIVKNKSNNTMRIWIAGCSTGQEVYSIAMCLHEYFSDRITNNEIRIFGTDISEPAIKKARTGIYTKKEIEGISESRLLQFFDKTDGDFQIKKSVRDMCVFAVQNFLKDPPFSNIDLVSCRNVLIYFEPFLQKKAFSMFHYALNDKGFLLLGKAEAIGNAPDLFAPFAIKNKIYTRIQTAVRFSGGETEFYPKHSTENVTPPDREIKKDDFQKSADDVMLLSHMPSGVVVNDQFDIVQFRGNTIDYLVPALGKATLNLFKMAKEDLGFELRNALHKAKISGHSVIQTNIPLPADKKSVSIEVIPLLKTQAPHFLILFKEPTGTKKPLKPQGNLDEKDKRIRHLENELARTRGDMMVITEDQESAKEELQSSNEELMSGSEELQSLNEELETSKEELQSTNEELLTVNRELDDRNRVINMSKKLADSTISLLHEPLLVLDRNFNIQSANKSFFKTFGLSKAEAIGKNLMEIQDRAWDIPDFRDQLSKICKEDDKMYETEATFIFPELGKCILCSNVQTLQNEGEFLILMALNDITLRKKAEILLKQKLADAALFSSLANAMPQKMWMADVGGNVNYMNDRWFDYTHLTFEELKDAKWENVIHPDDLTRNKREMLQSIEFGKDFETENRILRYDGNYRWHLSRSHAHRDETGKVISWVGTHTDINDYKILEEELQKEIVQKVKAENKKNDFISMASHELKTPLTSIKGYTQVMLQKFKSEGNSEAGLFLSKMEKSIDRLNFLISDLLDTTNISDDQLKFMNVSFDFNVLVKEIVEEMAQTTKSQILIPEFNKPVIVFCDRNRIGQVMTNIISNAIKYSPKENKIIITTECKNDIIKFNVRDFGIGIPAEKQLHVFEQFYRVTGLEQNRFTGLGLGLFIASEIIKKYKGVMSVESEVGKGSTFSFTLPYFD
ncbi:chemotaxis protein CheB [soil metagenome]